MTSQVYNSNLLHESLRYSLIKHGSNDIDENAKKLQLIERFVGSGLISYQTNDFKIAMAIIEVLRRLLNNIFKWLLEQETTFRFVIAQASYPTNTRVCCPGGHKNIRVINVPVIVLSGELTECSHEVVVGVVAHELAHLRLLRLYPEGSLSSHEMDPNREERADKLASRWGFSKEIREVRKQAKSSNQLSISRSS